MKVTMAAATLLVLVLVLVLSGCGSSGTSPGGGSACKVGDMVGAPTTTDGVPPCAENAEATLTYGCYPKFGGKQDGSWYAVEVSQDEELYGKPGGQWVKAASPLKLDEAAMKSIGC